MERKIRLNVFERSNKSSLQNASAFINTPILSIPKGAPVALWNKRWPANLAVPGSSPGARIF